MDDFYTIDVEKWLDRFKNALYLQKDLQQDFMQMKFDNRDLKEIVFGRIKRKEEKMKLPEFCNIHCPHCIENVEEYDDGTGCAWYECEITGQMIEHMEDCPIVKEEEE